MHVHFFVYGTNFYTIYLCLNVLKGGRGGGGGGGGCSRRAKWLIGK